MPDRSPTIDNPWQHLRQLTPARIALGRAGISLPTGAQLDFQFAHAQARDAVHLPLDCEALATELDKHNLAHLQLHSAASDRQTYLQRPDLGRRLDDASAAALVVAQRNAQRHAIGNVAFVHGDWLAPLAGQHFDLIVSNPPYIEAADPHLAQGDLRFEPSSALASGGDGLDDIRRIVRDARAHLHPGGWLLFEHGWNQGAAVRALLAESGYTEVFTAQDLELRDRVSGGRC